MLPSPQSPFQSRLIWLAANGVAAAVLLALSVAAVWGLGRVLDLFAGVLWPLALAGVISYLLDPVVDFLERHKVRRARAIFCVFALALALFAALAGSVLPQAILEIRELVAKVPTYARRLETRMEEWVRNPPAPLRHILPVPETAPPDSLEEPGDSVESPTSGILGQTLDTETIQSAATLLARAGTKIGSWLLGQASRVASWFGVLAGLALAPVYAFYFLLEKRGIESRWVEYLPVARSEFRDELAFVIRSINDYLITFFRGQVLVAFCDGILYTAGFLLVGLPYAILLGVMATCLTMIPFVGAIITCIVALVIAFAQFGDWLHPLFVLGVFAFVQSIEGLLVAPRIMGDRVGLHPLTIIVAVMVGTTLFGGMLGGILAIPLTATLRVLMFRYVWQGRTAAEKNEGKPPPAPAHS